MCWYWMYHINETIFSVFILMILKSKVKGHGKEIQNQQIQIDYRWKFQLICRHYQPKCISHSFVFSKCTVRKTCCSFIQFTNLGLFLTCVYRTAYIPSIWLVFGLIIFEGLIGGGAYVNTFYRILVEVGWTKNDRKLSQISSFLLDSRRESRIFDGCCINRWFIWNNSSWISCHSTSQCHLSLTNELFSLSFLFAFILMIVDSISFLINWDNYSYYYFFLDVTNWLFQ